MKKHFILWILCSWISQMVSIASTDNFLFKQLSVSDGFPTSIQTIYAEENGHVWIGNEHGLGKFDGYELKTYFHQPNNPASLPGNKIYQIEEDHLHNLWILTDRGLATYQKNTDCFTTLTDENGQTFVATASCKMPNKILFVSNNHVIYQYDYHEKRIRTLLKFKTTTNSFIKELWLWDSHTLLCQKQWGGIFLLDLNNGKISPSPLSNRDKITRTLIDRKGRIWTSPYNKGLICSDKKGNIIATYTTENSNLSHNIILCLSEHKGNIWVGTDGGGINLIHPEKKSVTTIKHISGDKNSLPINSIQCLFQRENQDGTWAGSIKGGLIYICNSFVRSYSDVPLNTPTGLSEKAVLSFYQEPGNQEIWIGTDGGGMNRFNPSTQQFVHYPNTWGEKIVAICGYSQQELLISIFAKGIFYFNKTTGKIRPFSSKNNLINQIVQYSRMGVNLYQNSPESIIILSSNIYRYYLKSNRIQQLTNKQIHIKGAVTPIGYDSLKTYLYDSKHIYAIDHQTNEMETIYVSPYSNGFECVTKDIHGTFWIGTANSLSSYNPKNQIETLEFTDTTKYVKALISDQQGHIWIGTNENLQIWFPNEKKLISLDESDGVTANEFLQKATLISENGDLYIGGINGMIYINKENMKIQIPDSPTLSLTDIVCDNKSYLSSIDNQKKLKLAYDNKTVTIKIIAHENNIFRKRMYRWTINGSEELTTQTNTPRITIYSMNHGLHHISVSCTQKDGSWSKPQHIITIFIPLVWYKTWWFNLLWISFVTALFIFIILDLLRRKEERMNMALKEHKQRIYEEKVHFLININHELRTPLTLIHTPLTQLLQKTSPNDFTYPILKNILKQSKRMRDLLNMVLNLRKMEMGKVNLNLQKYPLNQWIKEILSDFKYEEEERKVTLKYDLSPEIGDVCFDKEKHIIILTNLINNAFKHSPEGSCIIIRTEKEMDKVRISVIDQGEGLHDIDSQQLFTRFYQGKNEKEGVGIGLSYSKILVELHNGKIGAFNNSDKGACFYYELPITQSTTSETCSPQEYLNDLTAESNKKEEYIPINNTIDTRNYSCLFVDDNENICHMILEELKDCFKNLYIASNGKEALDIAIKEIPDIIISDIMMPQMNGYELCRNIKENMNINHIQVILLTARTDEQSHVDGYKTGADAYIEKPFEINTLLETIKNRLYLREQIRLRYINTPLTEISETTINSADDTFLFKLNKLIMEHMDNEDLNVGFICQEIGTSRASLYNRLKQLINMSPNEYINKLRMEKAMVLLRQTDLNITEISERTGFSSSRYFSTAFKKYTGTTPTQYKSEEKNTNENNI